MKTAVTLSLALCCGACTTIEIRNDRGDIRVERSFGFASVNVSPDAGLITARISSLGYVSTPLGHSAGWSRQSITASDGGCRIIVWIDERQDREAISRELESVASVCVVE